MKNYTKIIEETVAEQFKVSANDAEEALKIAEERYKKCDFVLEPGEVIYKQISVVEPKNEVNEWIEY